MKKNAFSILAIIIENLVHCISPAAGQVTQDASITGRFLKIGLPIVHNQVKENLLAPLRWDGVGGGLGIYYLMVSPKAFHEISLLMNVSELKNRYNHNGYSLEATLEYNFNCNVSSTFFSGDLFLGPQLKWDATINFFSDWDDSHIYWLNSYELGPSLEWSKNYKEKQNISITVQFPLFVIVSRPPEYQYKDQPPLIKPTYYFKSMNEDLRFFTVSNFSSLRLQANYLFRIKKDKMIGGTWIFDFKTCKLPRSTTTIKNILMLNYYKMFGKK